MAKFVYNPLTDPANGNLAPEKRSTHCCGLDELASINRAEKIAETREYYLPHGLVLNYLFNHAARGFSPPSRSFWMVFGDPSVQTYRAASGSYTGNSLIKLLTEMKLAVVEETSTFMSHTSNSTLKMVLVHIDRVNFATFGLSVQTMDPPELLRLLNDTLPSGHWKIRNASKHAGVTKQNLWSSLTMRTAQQFFPIPQLYGPKLDDDGMTVLPAFASTTATWSKWKKKTIAELAKDKSCNVIVS